MANDLTSKEYTTEELKKSFIRLYSGNEAAVRLYSSPARINIIGEHIDYNGGKVFPASINRYLYIAIRKRADSKVLYNDVRFPGSYEFDINQNFVYDKANDYANYFERNPAATQRTRL